jgi:hypothetical protein
MHVQMRAESWNGPSKMDVEPQEGGPGNINSAGNKDQQRTYRLRSRMANYFKRYTQLFSEHRNRHAAWAAIVVMISQQLCGVNILGKPIRYPQHNSEMRIAN